MLQPTVVVVIEAGDVEDVGESVVEAHSCDAGAAPRRREYHVDANDEGDAAGLGSPPSHGVHFAMPLTRSNSLVPALQVLPENTVYLNVYDIVEANHFLYHIGLGVHHSGVEVYGTEVAFGRCRTGTGVFETTPRQTEPHVFREQFVLGTTPYSRTEVVALIEQLKDDMEHWAGARYHLLERNCNTFSEQFAKLLLTPETRLKQHQRLVSFTATCGGRSAPPVATDPKLASGGLVEPFNPTTVGTCLERLEDAHIGGSVARAVAAGGALGERSWSACRGFAGTRRDDICQELYVAGSGTEEVMVCGRYVRVPGLMPAYVDRLARLGRQLLPRHWVELMDELDRGAQSMEE